MEFVNLGNSDLKVSKICLGCMSFGVPKDGGLTWKLPFPETREIIKYALDKGINFFDTEIIYTNGTSEEFIGKILKEFRKRDEVIIATKIAPKGAYPDKKHLTTRKYVEECINNSLKRLQVEYIDLYILHFWDYQTPISEYLESFHHFIQKGKIRYIGLSNCFTWQFVKANAIAKEN